MSEHVCPRCGHEDHCGYGSWFDRHPVMTTVGALFSLTFMGMLFSVYTSAAWTMVTLAATAVGVRVLAKERQRRSALAARADYEHAQLMARAQMPAVLLHPRDARSPRPSIAERHVLRGYPTTPIQTGTRR